MPSSPNGRYGPHEPTRHLRFDDVFAIMERNRPREPRPRGGEARTTTAPWLGRTISGRRFVIGAGVAVLVIWGSLYVVFREWRARYRERAAYGANQVAPAIDAFAGATPPGLDAGRWRDAVDRTHAMLVTITASNLLGLDEMRTLRDELDRAAARARAHPDKAVAELAAVWDDMFERGEFLFRDTRALKPDRHPRPGILSSYGADRVAPALDPLGDLEPPGVDTARWRDAVARTRALVLDVTDSRLISTMRMKELRKHLDRTVARARAHPDTAVGELAAVWDALQRIGRSQFLDRTSSISGHVRPEVFPRRY